jgi:predicted transcriptional regulator
MKTMKLIVLCLSLFLVSHSIFAQSSEKQAKYDKLEQKMAFLNDTIKKLEFLKKNNNLNEKQKADLKFYQDWRDVLENQIQKLFAEMVKEAVGGIPIQNERQKIEELTRRYWAKQLSWHDYVDQIFGNRSQISFNGKKYAVGLWEKKANEKLHKINQCNDEMQIIRYDLIDEVYKMTNFVYKPNITPNNIKTIPNDPYYFSNKINEKVDSITHRPLQQNTLQNIQQTFNNAAAEHAKVNSEKEKAKKEYDELQKALDSLNNLCPDCKQ